jgi:hypothetical protein
MIGGPPGRVAEFKKFVKGFVLTFEPDPSSGR